MGNSNAKSLDSQLRRVADYGKLKCWYTNATSLNNKLELLRRINQDYDILMVTETWFNENSTTEVKGYHCYRQDRRQKLDKSGKPIGGGGGVCIYVRQCSDIKIKSIPTRLETEFTSTLAEQVWCQLKVDKKKILLGCIYRPPKADSDESQAINNSIRKAWKEHQNKKVDHLLICGDFNYPKINWSSTTTSSATATSANNNTRGISKVEAEFKSLIEQLNAVQNVTERTYQRGDVGQMTNTLDLVLTEKERRCRDMTFDRPLGDVKHGHVQISWEYKFKNKGLLRKLFVCFSN